MSKRKLKICHVITRMIVGGAQENTLLSVQGMVANGHHVTLLTGASPGPEGELLSMENLLGFSVIELPLLVRPIAPIADLRAYLALQKIFKKEKFDVVHTHASKAGIIARLAAYSAKIPLVVHTVHGQAFHQYQNCWKNLLYIIAERIAGKVSHKIYTVAQAMIEQCVNAKIAPREKYQVVYSGMDIEKFANTVANPQLQKKLGLESHHLVIGKIARFFELKGHKYLLQIAPQIIAKYPHVRFLLVGDGILKSRFQEQIKQLKLQKYFIFTGLIPPSQVSQYIALMDILLHLSLREGLPRTVVQALAAQVPAIGFDLDGTPEVILHGKTGYICPAKDTVAVQNAVFRLLDNPQQRSTIGKNGQKLVLKQFAWQNMVQTLEDDYYKLLAEKGKLLI